MRKWMLLRKDTLQWLIPVLLALGAAAALWFYWLQTERQQTPVEREVPDPGTEIVDEAPPEQPAHPIEAAAEAAAEEPELRPLPPLDESDEYFRLEATELFGQELDEMLVEDQVIERIVATVDNLSREQIAERIKPLTGAGGQFVVQSTGDDEYVLHSDNYRRYDRVIGLMEGADMDRAEDLYRRFYPLFQAAFEELGYPEDYFNDRLIEVIDHLLETPEVEEPITLVRPHVLYEYADPQLEALSPGRKLLLRMGGEHRATVKETLRDFRARISER